MRIRVFLMLGCLGLAPALSGAKAFAPDSDGPAAEAPKPRYAGRPLEAALFELRARGLRIVFSSNVVRPEMRVEREPAASEPRQVLEEILAPHGLIAREGPNGILVVVPRPTASTAVPPLGAAANTPLREPMPVFREEIVVTPSRISLLREAPIGTLGLSREEILALPHLGDDLFRALTLMPGVTANDTTAQLHVRGGRYDETQILIDGQELFEPFHLKDFDSALSFVAPATLSRADLSTGAFPARYGDRMSGVLDMTTLTPAGAPRVRLGIGILGADAGGGGTFHGERGAWLAEARRGSSDLLGRLLGDEDPRYWDAFGKLELRPSSRQSVRANLLHSGDALDFGKTVAGETKRYETNYDSTYLWLTHQTLLGAGLALESALSRTRINRDRRGRELEEDARFAILDERDSDVLGLRQSWSFQAAPRHLLEGGWQLRELETEYDYFGTHELEDPLARLRHDFGTESTAFAGRFKERETDAYVADRLQLREPLTLELGLRYDRYPLTEESHVSPRLDLAYALGEHSLLRLAWGRYVQSQRAYELQVEDGETAFHPVERSEHRVIGFEQLLDAGPSARGLALRVELYQRRVGNPRPRYENLFEPLSVFPEVEPDRVRIAPTRSTAEGVELFLGGHLWRRADGWISYAYASTEDDIAGHRIPRLFDQTHSVNADLDVHAGEHWRLNLAWRYHTGWPTTPLAVQQVQDDEGEVEPAPLLGRLNSGRLPGYHRLDVRASRRWQLGARTFDFFVDIQNLYNRRSVAGFDYEIDTETGALRTARERWPGFLPSAGISFEF